jgi:predicted protein tyrosine phosphatase
MELIVYSRAMIESIAPPDVPYVILSITSRVSDVARLPVNELCQGVLRQSFPDADGPSMLYTEDELFSPTQAAEVWAFVRQHRPSIARILVHCDAGISRSSAMAAAISKALTGDDKRFFGARYLPNRRVYRLMLEAYEE